jgi:hypothetical protein
MPFCRHCGDLVLKDRCGKCGGRPVGKYCDVESILVSCAHSLTANQPPHSLGILESQRRKAQIDGNRRTYPNCHSQVHMLTFVQIHHRRFSKTRRFSNSISTFFCSRCSLQTTPVDSSQTISSPAQLNPHEQSNICSYLSYNIGKDSFSHETALECCGVGQHTQLFSIGKSNPG